MDFFAKKAGKIPVSLSFFRKKKCRSFNKTGLIFSHNRGNLKSPHCDLKAGSISGGYL